MSSNAGDSAFRGTRTNLSLIMGVAARLDRELLSYLWDAIDSTAAEDPNLGRSYQFLVAMASLALGQVDRATSYSERLTASGDALGRDLGALVQLLSVLGGVADPSFADDAIDHFGESDSPVARRYMEGMRALIRSDPARAREMLGTDPSVFGASRHRAAGMLGWASLLEGDTASAVAQMRMALDSAESGLGNGQLYNTFRYHLGRVLARQPETYEQGIRWLRYGFPVSTGPEMRAAGLLAAAEEM